MIWKSCLGEGAKDDWMISLFLKGILIPIRWKKKHWKCDNAYTAHLKEYKCNYLTKKRQVITYIYYGKARNTQGGCGGKKGIYKC